MQVEMHCDRFHRGKTELRIDAALRWSIDPEAPTAAIENRSRIRAAAGPAMRNTHTPQVSRIGFRHIAGQETGFESGGNFGATLPIQVTSLNEACLG